MVEDTAEINGIVNTLIEDYNAIFNPSSENELVAVVLYDHNAKDPDELSLRVGQRVKVFSQDPSGCKSRCFFFTPQGIVSSL